MGAGVVQYISVRSALAFCLSLLIVVGFGGRFIRWLKKMQIGESVRDLGLEGQKEKQGTPTMGGIIIIAGIVIPVLLFAKINNIYIIIMLITTIWLGAMGFLDDYIKVFRKNKDGLKPKYKLLGQIVIGIFVACMMCFSPQIRIYEKQQVEAYTQTHNLQVSSNYERAKQQFTKESVHSTKTTMPFVKNHEIEYSKVLKFLGPGYEKYAFLVVVLVVILVVMAVSNGCNLTDGIDGLCVGVSAISGSALLLLAWISGNLLLCSYFDLLFIPNIGELSVFGAAFIGSCCGFLWWNSYPASVFMGDTGSLCIGGIIGVFALLIRKEWLLVLLCGVFLIENLSVIIQRYWFKYTKKKYGQGRRVFLMSPLHHHFQLKGIKEPKIVQRFYLVALLLAVATIITIKIR